MRMVWVSDILIVCFIGWNEALSAVFNTEKLTKFMLHIITELLNEVIRVLVEINHVLLVKCGPFVLFECILVLALLLAHLTVVFMFA